MRIIRLFAVTFLPLLAPIPAIAQSVMARVIERSIDVRVLDVLDSQTVVIGKLVTVMSKSDRVTAVVDVEETLKGEHEKFRQIQFRAFGDRENIRKIYKENKTVRLLFYDSSFVVLSSSAPQFRTLDGGTVAGTDAVLSYLRDLIRKHPNWKKGEKN